MQTEHQITYQAMEPFPLLTRRLPDRLCTATKVLESIFVMYPLRNIHMKILCLKYQIPVIMEALLDFREDLQKVFNVPPNLILAF